MAELRIHKLPKKIAVYALDDPAGNYLCGTCMMYLPSPNRNGVGGCTAVRPNSGETDGLHISANHGGCNLYIHGRPASPENTNPHRLSKADTLYSISREGFGCRRCRHFLPLVKRCVRVSEEGEPAAGRIDPFGCCNGWERRAGY